MDAWEAIMVYDSEKAYVDSCRLFKIVCTNFPKNLEYVETAILGHVKEKVARYWTNRVMHI